MRRFDFHLGDMLISDVLGQPIYNPAVQQSLRGLQPFRRLPLQTHFDETAELLVFAFHN